MIFRASRSRSLGGRRADRARTRSKSCAAALLWLLLASAFVGILAQRTPPVNAFQATGQFAMTVIGQPNFLSAAAAAYPISSSSNSATQSGLNGPFKLAFDPSGDLWVADEANHRVLEFKPPFADGMNASLVLGQGNFTANGMHTTQSGTSEDAGVTIDAQGDVWVSDWINNRVLEFKPPFTDGMNASLELGQPPGSQEFTSDGTVTKLPGQVVNPHLANELAAPVDVAFDSSGNLWVSDRLNDRVLEFKPPFASGMNASSVIGQGNLTAFAFSATPTASSLYLPQGLAFDSQGNLWVADQRNNRILEFAASSLGTDHPQAVLEIGQPPGPHQFSNNTATDTPGGLDQPTVIAFDSSGDLWVADHVNNRVLEFKPPFADGESASLEIGQQSGPMAFTSSGSATSQDGFNNPLGIAFDSSGNLWVADQGNNRLLEFSSDALETAGTTISILNATEGTIASASQGQGSCSKVGVLVLCHLVVDQTTATGVKTDVTGTASGSTANVYSSYLGDEAPGYAGMPPFQSAAAYYGLSIAGIENGTATVCIDQQSAGEMAYYSDGAWTSPTSITKSAASTCGTLPLSAMSYGEVVIALEKPTAPSSSGSSSQLTLVFQISEAAALVGGTAIVAVTLIVRRRRGRPEPGAEGDEDEGLDEWA